MLLLTTFTVEPRYSRPICIHYRHLAISGIHELIDSSLTLKTTLKSSHVINPATSLIQPRH